MSYQMIEPEDIYLINGDDFELTLYDNMNRGYIEISSSKEIWRLHGLKQVTLSTKIRPDDWPKLTRLQTIRLYWRLFTDTILGKFDR